ncbi:YidH family protein [Pseudokineococcus sp. 1T1Z-3]|uniref:YidH family protein n=1 Tax=Pseudokineococcus sp. 1T1Z-3 TaxID=3132745 RepID=UPI003094FBD7
MGERARFPRRVYAHGEEPDPRFSLANERTFLAWVRTALALLAAGVAVEALALPLQETLRQLTAVLFVVMGLLSSAQAWFGWARAERALRLGRPLPSPALSGVVAAGVVLAGVLLVVGVLL